MTLPGVGKVTPFQLSIMQLAGLVLSERGERIEEPSPQEIAESKEEAYRELCENTGEDFGYDVDRWYEFLIVGDYGITHPYGRTTMRRFLKQQGFQAPFKKEVLAKLRNSQSPL